MILKHIVLEWKVKNRRNFLIVYSFFILSSRVFLRKLLLEDSDSSLRLVLLIEGNLPKSTQGTTVWKQRA